MTDEEFYKLHCELDGAYLKLNYLQDKYRKETGRLFVFGQSYKSRSAQQEDSPDKSHLKGMDTETLDHVCVGKPPIY